MSIYYGRGIIHIKKSLNLPNYTVRIFISEVSNNSQKLNAINGRPSPISVLGHVLLPLQLGRVWQNARPQSHYQICSWLPVACVSPPPKPHLIFGFRSAGSRAQGSGRCVQLGGLQPICCAGLEPHLPARPVLLGSDQQPGAPT